MVGDGAVCPMSYSFILCLMDVVHRIGRTGRCGKTGLATTFINKGCCELVEIMLIAIGSCIMSSSSGVDFD